MTELSRHVPVERRDVLRLAESRSGYRVAVAEFPGCVPVHRAIMGIDVVNSSVRVNPAKALLRRRMHGILEESLLTSGITDQNRDAVVDRGDGALVLIKPADEVPKTVLLAKLVPALEHLLGEHNSRDPRHAFQLRVAVHAGEVHFDRWGPFGEALDVACRLLDAPVLKATVAGTDVPLALVVSDDFYRSIVRHGYGDIDSTSFTPLVRVEVAGTSHSGWIRDVALTGAAATLR